MGFDPVSFLMGAKSAGGGGGSGGGFTLLQGTYTAFDGQETVTLTITASDLYTLMQTSAVSLAWAVSTNGDTYSFIYPISMGNHIVEDGDSSYVFQCDRYATQLLSASDAVVFEHNEK